MRAATLVVAALTLWMTTGEALHAQQDFFKGVSDPTKAPPGVMLQPKDGTPEAAASAASSASQADEVKAKPIVLTLQAIRYDVATGQAVAMINDELVQVGGKVEGMSVVSISRNVAVLKGSSGMRRLTLLDEEETGSESKSDKSQAARRGRKERK